MGNKSGWLCEVLRAQRRVGRAFRWQRHKGGGGWTERWSKRRQGNAAGKSNLCNAALALWKEKDEEMIEGAKRAALVAWGRPSGGKGRLRDVAGVLASAALLRVFARPESTGEGETGGDEEGKNRQYNEVEDGERKEGGWNGSTDGW